ncbi:sigma-54-dependent Fis family transcriptional regulator [Shewanella sp. 202IG2-18]|uniref:sigma-54 interaction domain-containing protein n=1 Tax=Parashewanella hymeniacidonis TaxID=2807618 RepID=UPI001961A394|nr:sigma-54-dependent Fis family transcriptional regulator [Parashewanella hymeniacidonis]
MNKYCIELIDHLISDDLIQALECEGFNLVTNCQQTPWLSLVNLSKVSAECIEVELAKVNGTNKVALLNAEQSENAAQAMKLGVQDYLLLPLQQEQLIALVIRLKELEKTNHNYIVSSPVSRQLLMLAHRSAMTEASVLITGESGTGKEPLARYIHQNSSRANKPFIAINCAAIPESILESLLFGHSKGAFTGAQADQPGKFELANGGTILLDEIGEMPLLLQAKLLRVLQEREVERLGDHKSISLDIRIIAATNRDLRAAVNNGEFREDLFYRLDVLPLKTLPLRERRSDILPLAEHFLSKYNMDTPLQFFSDQAKQVLMAHDWPGNVRELENCIQRALVLRRGQVIQMADLGLEIKSSAVLIETKETSLKQSKQQAEFQFVIDALKRFNGHRCKTAEFLEMTTRALRYKLAQMREQGIDIDTILTEAKAA